MSRECSPPIMCHLSHMSHFRCQVPGVTYKVPQVTCNSQSLKARKLIFFKVGSPLPTCHVLCFTCHVSPVACPSYDVLKLIYIFLQKKRRGSRWRICHRQSLPRQVFTCPWPLGQAESWYWCVCWSVCLSVCLHASPLVRQSVPSRLL